ncbi:Trafficking protein particle complex subunit 12 [Mortierella polycephala]|uniref:Trafficking protein particle complex subunit 12 n=1 Tax=Mortierella polycephala TaxID=41804 RepID=A0A9P6QA80_9FUNG|nr:Trafficking protein particle complex subunit 12 [Mortierella polycephala]
MSRSVPFEDPLLHPPTPPINTEAPAETPKEQGTAQEQQKQEDPFDDGPIPFSSASEDSSSVFSPLPIREQTSDATAKEASTEDVSSQTEFIDPLSAAAGNQDEHDHGHAPTQGNTSASVKSTEAASVPNISIPAGNNNMPTELPTHLASPPLPQRPSSTGGTAFSVFQAFSSVLQPPSNSVTPAESSSISSSATPTPTPTPAVITNSPLDDPTNRSKQQTPDGFGVESHQTGSESPSVQPWNKRLSVGVSTNPSGISLHDHSDMVRQDLKSPDQEQPSKHPLSAVPSNQIYTKPTGHGREHSIGLRSPVFAVQQNTLRQEGYPVLNTHSMFHEITTPDAMNDLMVRHIPVELRVLRDWSVITETEQRQESRSKILHELTVNNSWRAMTRYTRSQILSTPSDQILELINLWYARLLALVKLGEYEMAQAELEQLGDLRGPQYRYENYPADMFANELETQEQQRDDVAQRRGCMVPFELFVLKARLQGYLGDVYEAIDQLYDLIVYCKKFEAICRVSEDNIGIRQWQDIAGQMHLMVLNYLVELNDYPTATRHAREMAIKYPQDVNFHSGLGRLYLQLGDLERAEEVFNEVERMVKEHYADAKQAHFQLQLTMNRALLDVTQGRWLAAKAGFEEVLVKEPENLAATNNLAVCELYAGQLNSAIPRIERLMFAYPTSAGASEPLVFNMATLYELRTEGSLRKKQMMLVEVSKWAGDQFNVGMFKI